jgi:hypothetical protein
MRPLVPCIMAWRLVPPPASMPESMVVRRLLVVPSRPPFGAGTDLTRRCLSLGFEAIDSPRVVVDPCSAQLQEARCRAGLHVPPAIAWRRRVSHRGAPTAARLRALLLLIGSGTWVPAVAASSATGLRGQNSPSQLVGCTCKSR